MASRWNRPWNNAAQMDRDLGQKTPLAQTRTTNLGQAQTKARGAIASPGLVQAGSRASVNQVAVKGSAGKSTGTFKGGYRESAPNGQAGKAAHKLGSGGRS